MTLSAGAWAQDASAADVERARAAFLQGLDLRDNKHDLAAAVAQFKAAYALIPTPRIGYELGRTLRSMGDLVGARAVFVLAAQLPVRATESAEAKKARTESEAQANELEARIPQIMLHLVGSGQIFVDGEAVRHDALATPRRVNPGSHVVQIQVEGDVKGEQSVMLREGERKDVTMSAGAEARVTVTAAAPEVQVVPLPNNGYQFQVRRSNAGTKAGLFYASATLAGVGLVPGLIALIYVKAAQNACNGSTCDASFDNNKTLAYGFGIATDVLWGSAIICLIAALAVPTYSGDVIIGASPVPGGGIFTAHGRF